MIILLLHFKIFMIITASYAFLVTITQHLGNIRSNIRITGIDSSTRTASIDSSTS